MKYSFIMTLILLLSLTACQDKEHDAKVQAAHDAKIIAQTRATVLAELNAQKEAEEAQVQANQAAKKEAQLLDSSGDKLRQLGINVNDDTIVIDTNTTKTFFKNLTQKMQKEISEISKDIQKGVIEKKEAGIEIDSEHISIDLNKTKNLLETWGQKIEVFVQEFDKIANPKETNTK